ncbi:YgjV family protein [Endozoicomonas sp. GU-1]|uniref:YgjV family protein n=1 Tax=Endozoicomonas sp. GU-1 TaxID=3009078 RepID=UPI0022B42AF7|nr:YgjV family protein [Endozoicomonas sp. GU-1]WBA82037.1 YgjV family protein [Endozoicomonas sp. GU-1]
MASDYRYLQQNLLREILPLINRETVMFIAQLVGGFAFLIGIMAFWQKDDVKFRYQMTAFSLVMALHFVLMGATVAAIGAVINSLRSYASVKSQSKILMAMFIVLLICLTLPNVEQWYEVPTIIGSVVATWALFSARGIPLRSLILLNSCCWLVHNLLTGSIGGSLIEATFVVTNSITIYKLYKAAVVSVPVIQEVKL